MKIPILLLNGMFAIVIAASAATDQATSALAHFSGPDFAGGAKDLFGSSFDGEQVNYIYAAPTGEHSTMRVGFEVATIPPVPLFAHLKARDDDGPGSCAIAIELNGKVLFEGANPFPQTSFETRKFSLPEGLLRKGANTLVIACREKQGAVGMPPWFQVAAVVIGPEKFLITPDPRKDFHVVLPEAKRPFPEPLPAGGEPGFKWRGTKGWMWTTRQTMAELPVLARFKMNFFMNCYGSMCDLEHYPWGNPECNRWWEPLPPEKKLAYEEIVRECRRLGIQYCFSMNPNLCSKRFINDGDPQSVDQLYQHYAWMQGLGVRWFNISLDDITQGINASGQAKVVNEILRRLRVKDPGVQMIFCPTFYWGDGTEKDQQPYLEILAAELDKEVYFFWTGDAVVGKISRKGADTFRRISGHRLFLWDNYPVNDNTPTMHLGPVIDRDSDLGEIVDGYMGNPLCKQNEANRLPLATCADYSWNPAAYDPARSIGQAILHLADTRPQQEALKDLVESYPGMLICARPSTGFNAVQEQYARITVVPHSRQAALAFIERMEGLSNRLKEEFPRSYEPARRTLDDDIRQMRQKFAAKYDGGL